MSGIAFKMSQMAYGKVEYNIVVSGIDFRDNDYLPDTYPEGIGSESDIDSVEKYGLAVHFAKILLKQKEFALSVSIGKGRNVYCGHIIDMPTRKAKIVIDSSTVEFLEERSKSLSLLLDGDSVASAYVKGLNSGDTSKPIEIYFRNKVIPASE